MSWVLIFYCPKVNGSSFRYIHQRFPKHVALREKVNVHISSTLVCESPSNCSGKPLEPGSTNWHGKPCQGLLSHQGTVIIFQDWVIRSQASKRTLFLLCFHEEGTQTVRGNGRKLCDFRPEDTVEPHGKPCLQFIK